MKYSNLIFFSCLLFSLSAASQAAESCTNESNTAKVIACFQTHLQQEDQRLNTVYKELRAKLTQTGQDLLRDGQRAWLQFRDSDCAWAVHTAAKKKSKPVILAACLADQTSLRADELETYLERYR